MRRPFAVGQWLRHERFGLGVTLASSDTRVTVQFDDHGAKTFVTELFEAEAVPAPDRPPARQRRKAPPA
jgi:hypothetical protein